MSREIERIIYQQRFESLGPVDDQENALTESLNRFIKTPKRSFNLFSVAKYSRTLSSPESLVAAPTMDKTAIKLDNESRRMGRVGVQLAETVGGVRLKNGSLRLSFYPHDLQAYWKIIHQFHADKVATPTTQEEAKEARAKIVTLAREGLYLNLPARELRSMAALKLASKGLQIAMSLPENNAQMKVEKVEGISAHNIYKNSSSTKPLSRPDIIDEGA